MRNCELRHWIRLYDISPRKSDEPRTRQSVHVRVSMCVCMCISEHASVRVSVRRGRVALALVTVVREKSERRARKAERWVRPCRLGRRGDEPSGRRPPRPLGGLGRSRELEPSGAEGRSRRVRSVGGWGSRGAFSSARAP